VSIAKRLSKAEIEGIYSAANSAVWHSHFCARSTARSTAREEDYVATLVTDGVPLLADRWIQILDSKGIALRVSGVFCHGHPQVQFGPLQSPVELADLLVVHQHSEDRRYTARAMLIQAKMSTDATHHLHASDPQLALFSRWPPFEFVTGGLEPGIRDIKEAGRGSRYALILQEHMYPEQITWADQCPWAVSPAKQELAAESSLARLLGNMILAKDGRPVQLTAPKDDWSRTIKDLLEISGKRTFRRANIGLGHTHRLSEKYSVLTNTLFLSQSPRFARAPIPRVKPFTSDLFFNAAVEIELDGDGNDPPDLEERRGPEDGMSALIIETLAGD
jgi:hypothetical protein